MNELGSQSSAQPAPDLSTARLRRNLDEIDHVIVALRVAPAVAADEGHDLLWLKQRRRYVLAVLAGRKAMQRHNIVSLEQWRTGGVDLRNEAASAA